MGAGALSGEEALGYDKDSPRQIIPAKIAAIDPTQSESFHVDSYPYITPTYTSTTQDTPSNPQLCT